MAIICINYFQTASGTDTKDGSNPGAAIGGVLAGIVIFTIVCLAVALVLYKQKRKRAYNVNQPKGIIECVYASIQVINIYYLL